MLKNPVRKTWYAVIGVLFLLLVALVAAACGTVTYTLTFVTNGAADIEPITAEAGAQITPPADPEKDGAVFDGWYTSADFSGEAVEIPSTMPAENITYYAKFTQKAAKATLTLDDAGHGSLAQTTYELEVGANVFDFVSGIAPTPDDGLTFSGWYIGNTVLGAGVTMPESGLTLLARYTVPYSVEVYLQNSPDETEAEDYTYVEDAGIEGDVGFVDETVDLTYSLTYTGYTLNTTLSLPLKLSATGENVYKAYFDLKSYSIYYSNNVPSGVEVDPVQETQTAYYNYEQQVLDNPFEIEGFRFAGWSTSPNEDAEITYAEGDTIKVTRTTILYACWNRGLKDANGGSDILYVMRETPGTINLVRQGTEERVGQYDAGTRYFYFGKNGEDNSLPRGRVSADGTTFSYYFGDMQIAYQQYDLLQESLVSGVQLTLNGIDEAIYVSASGADPVSGTYTPEDGEYLFAANDGSVSFYFRLATYQGNDVFVVRDGVGGSYSYLNGQTVALFPFIVMDGYGGASLLNGFTDNDFYTGAYEGTKTDGIYLLSLRNASGTALETLAWFGEYSGKSVFVFADGIQGTYTFAMTSSAYGEGTMTAVLDGFGSAAWKFTPNEGQETSGSATYTYVAGYQGEAAEPEGEAVSYGIVRLTVGGVTTYTLRFTLDGSGNYQATLIGDEAGIYSEYNAVSGYTVRILLQGEENRATLNFAMTDGSYVALVEGTYEPVADEENIYTFTATKYSEGYEDSLAQYYGTFRFRIYADQGVFIMSDGVEGTYTFTLDSQDWTFTCNGFGYATATWGTSSGTAFYTVTDGYDGCKFIRFGYNNVNYYIRVMPDASSGQTAVETEVFSGLAGSFVDLGNRMSAYTERLLLFPDGHAIVRVTTDENTTVDIPGSYEMVPDSKGEFYVFTASGSVDPKYDCYSTFTFSAVTISGTYAFCYYLEDEAAVLTFRGQTLTLSGYGIATYQTGTNTTTQYRYYFEDDGTDTWLCLATISGSLAYRIRYDFTSGSIIEEPGTEQGSYYSYLYSEEEGGYRVGAYVLTLDGYGGAVFATAKDGVYEETAVGTYTVEGDVYELTWTGEASVGFTAVILSSATLTDGSSVKVYIQGDPAKEAEYYVQEGGETVATFAMDQFGRMTYTDADQKTWRASFASGESSATGQNLFVAIIYGETGSVTATNMYLLGAENILTLTDNRCGSYSYLDGERIYRTDTLVLDGFGSAVYTAKDSGAVNGKYTPVEGSENEFVFTADDESQTFTFMLTSVSVSGQTYSVWLRYEEAWATTLTSEDWQLITVDGYISATLIDFYGKVYSANYTVLWTGSENSILHLYGTTLGDKYFLVSGTSFVEMEASENNGFIVRDNVLLAYQGNGGAVVIPDGVTEIADSVFYQRSDVTSVDLNDVTKVGDYAFQGTGLTLVESTLVTSVGTMSFYLAESLAAVSLPSVIAVGNYAFAGCTALTQIDLAQAQTIGEYAFAECDALVDVSLAQVRTIGAYAFAGCELLKTVSLGENLVSIGDFAFAESATQEGASLTLTLAGSNVPTMGGNVFGEEPTATIQIVVPQDALSAYQEAWTENGYAAYLSAAGTEQA